jgi:hypothetical protein
MHTQKVLIYTCALVTSASALFISHNVRQDSEEFIRQSANIVESPWRLVAVPPVSVPAKPMKEVAAITLTQIESPQDFAVDFSANAYSDELALANSDEKKSIYKWVDENGTVHYTDLQKGEKLGR